MGKAFRKVEDKVSDFFRPVNKTLRKTGIGKILPYASMALPFFGPGLGSLARYLIPQALTATGRSIEGKKFSPLAQGITAASSFVGSPSGGTGSTKLNLEGKNFLDKVKAVGGQTGDFIKEAVQEDPYSKLKAAGTIGAAMGASDAYDSAKKAEEDFRRRYEGSAEGYDDAVLKYLRSYMANAGYSNDEIQNYLSNRYMYAANGGRVGFAGGGSSYYDTSTYMDLYDDYQEDILEGVIDIDMSFENWIQNRNESMIDDRYKKGGRVGFGDGGTSNRESSGIIEMEMIDPETGQKKQFFGSLYDEDIIKGIINRSITPLETHPLLEGMKKGGRVGLAFGGNPDDLLLELEEEDTPSIIDQIKETGSISTAMGPRDGEPTGDPILDSLIEESIDEQKGRMMASNDQTESALEAIYEELLEQGYAPDIAAKIARQILEDRSSGFDPSDFYKKGGRVGLAGGGMSDSRMAQLLDMLKNETDPDQISLLQDEIQRILSGSQKMKKGGIASLEMGGMPSMEMDYRGGGFIPVGSKEKADDVPARLSKNEFVMTADAVRAAGGGSVNKGAQRMYQLMNQLEAKV